MYAPMVGLQAKQTDHFKTLWGIDYVSFIIGDIIFDSVSISMLKTLLPKHLHKKRSETMENK